MKKLFVTAFCVCATLSSFAQTNSQELAYRRSSLATIIVVNPDVAGSTGANDAEAAAICKDVPALFESMPLPDKYDALKLSERSLLLTEAPKDLKLSKTVLPSKADASIELDAEDKPEGLMGYIEKFGLTEKLGLGKVDDKEVIGKLLTYFNNNHTAQQIIHQWYIKSDGKFSDFADCMVQERAKKSMTVDEDKALQDLSLQQRKTKESNIADELINKSFIMVNVCTYKSADMIKATIQAAAQEQLSSLPAIALNAAMKALDKALANVKGYLCFYKTYLFRVNYSINDFYTQWIEGNNNPAAFLKSDFGKITYCGRTKGFRPIVSAKSQKTTSDVIQKVTSRIIDESIAKLQKNYEDFKTLSTLHASEDGKSLYAYIGTKEGLEKGNVFDVLEKTEDEAGHVTYKSIGTVSPIKDQIWDNAGDEETETKLEFTSFKGNAKKFAAKLIRFKK